MKNHAGTAGGGAIYGMGVVGAIIYFLQHSTTLAAGVIGIIKGLFWPAVVVYKALELLKIS